MKHSTAPVPVGFLNSRASGSVAEAWVAFGRFPPRSEGTNATDGVDGSRFRHRNVPCWAQ